MSTFVFFHVGDDLTWPRKLIASVRKSNPNAEIIMASDPQTPVVEGVNRRVDIKGDRDEIMLMRVAGFAAAQVGKPALYLDTDMVVLENIDVEALLGRKDAVLCKRFFNKEAIFNHNLRGMDFSEYKGMTLNEVYPILACATVTRDWKPWGQMTAMMEYIHKKFKRWYGDQEVLRLYSNEDNVGYLCESEYACLPEFERTVKLRPKIIHYKGGRK
jgi:hypothetical protein